MGNSFLQSQCFNKNFVNKSKKQLRYIYGNNLNILLIKKSTVKVFTPCRRLCNGIPSNFHLSSSSFSSLMNSVLAYYRFYNGLVILVN